MAYGANKIWNKILLLPRRQLRLFEFSISWLGLSEGGRGGGARRETGVLEMLLKNSIANNWSRFVEHCCRCTGNFERANKTESHSTDFHETFGRGGGGQAFEKETIRGVFTRSKHASARIEPQFCNRMETVIAMLPCSVHFSFRANRNTSSWVEIFQIRALEEERGEEGIDEFDQ